MNQPTKFFSSVEPKQSTRPQARQFVVGDEWHSDDGGGVWTWDGSCWTRPPVEVQQQLDDSAKLSSKATMTRTEPVTPAAGDAPTDAAPKDDGAPQEPVASAPAASEPVKQSEAKRVDTLRKGKK